MKEYTTHYQLRARKFFTNQEKEIQFEEVDTELENKIVKDIVKKINSSENAKNLHDIFKKPLGWCNSNEDMIELSKKYPSVLFILSGVGEDDYDEWQAVYYKGVSDKVKSEYGTAISPIIDITRFLRWYDFVEM